MFSIYLFHWDSSEMLNQDRFHSHAFNSICLKISGKYTEEVITETGIYSRTNPLLRFIKRNHIHRIIKSEPNSFSFVIAGPWQNNWWEFFPESNTWVQYGTGRRVLKEQENFPSSF